MAQDDDEQFDDNEVPEEEVSEDTLDVPPEVADEFEASLDQDIENWTEAIRAHIDDYEGAD